MTITRAPSCDDASEPGLLPVEEARRRLSALLSTVSGVDKVTVRLARNRVLAQDVHSPIDVPSHTNSAMDGYAIDRGSIPDQGEAVLSLVGTAWAGRPFEGAAGAGEAVRVFTGAIMPAGTDTVVIQEHVALDDPHSVRIDDAVQAGRNVRAAGEDVQAGECVMRAGTCIGAAEMGVLASLGVAQVSVTRRVRVAFFTTGDELRSLETHAGQKLAPGLLFDSNRYLLLGLLEALGVTLVDLGVVPDDPKATRDAFERAAAEADLIVTSGGVSAGAADHVTDVLHALGDVAFWKIAMRPGRPLAVGTLGSALFFGLPGNPVAVMVTFLEFVQPAIRQLMGMRDTHPQEVQAVCDSALKKSPGRVEYQRGIMRTDEQGVLRVVTTGKQGAGRLSSMHRANCLIVLPPELDAVTPGMSVSIQPFHGLLP